MAIPAEIEACRQTFMTNILQENRVDYIPPVVQIGMDMSRRFAEGSYLYDVLQKSIHLQMENYNTIRYRRWQVLDAANLVGDTISSPLLFNFMKRDPHAMSHILTFLTLSDNTCLFRTSKQTILEIGSPQIMRNSGKVMNVPEISMMNLFHSHPKLSYFGTILPYVTQLNINEVDDSANSMDEFSCFRRPSQNVILPSQPFRAYCSIYNHKDDICPFNFEELVSHHRMAILLCKQGSIFSNLRHISICAHPYAANQVLDGISDSVIQKLRSIKIKPSNRKSRERYEGYAIPTGSIHALGEEKHDYNKFRQERCSELYTRLQYCTNLRTLQIQHPLMRERHNREGNMRSNEYSMYLCSVKSLPVNLQELSLSSLYYYTHEFTEYISTRSKNLIKFSSVKCKSSYSSIIRRDDLSVMEHCEEWYHDAIVTTSKMTDSIIELDVMIGIDEIPNLSKLSSLTNLSVMFTQIHDVYHGGNDSDDNDVQNLTLEDTENMIKYSTSLVKYCQHIPLKKLKISDNHYAHCFRGGILPDPAILSFEHLEELEIVSMTLKFPVMKMCKKLQKLSFTYCRFVCGIVLPGPDESDESVMEAEISSKLLAGIYNTISGLKLISLNIIFCYVFKEEYQDFLIDDCRLSDPDITTIKVICESKGYNNYYHDYHYSCRITN